MRRVAVLLVAACASACASAPAARISPPPAPLPDASYVFRYVGAPSPFVEIAVTARSADVGPTTFDLGDGFADVSDPETSVRDVSAQDDLGAPLAVAHPTPHTWRVDAAAG